LLLRRVLLERARISLEDHQVDVTQEQREPDRADDERDVTCASLSKWPPHAELEPAAEQPARHPAHPSREPKGGTTPSTAAGVDTRSETPAERRELRVRAGDRAARSELERPASGGGRADQACLYPPHGRAPSLPEPPRGRRRGGPHGDGGGVGRRGLAPPAR